MKKLLVVLLMLICNFAISQTGWFQQNSGTTQGFNCVYFLNDQTGFAGGGFKIYKTTNGGITWNQNILSDTTTLTVIRFLNNTTGYACGGRYVNDYYSLQHLFKTTNSGDNWIKIHQYSGAFTDEKFNDVYPVDTLVYLSKGGFGSMATVGSMLLSQNSGMSFNILNFSYEEYVGKTSFINSQTGWVTTFFRTDVPGSKRKIFKTTNHGQNWTMQFRDSTTNHPFTTDIFELQFINQNTGFGLYSKEYPYNIAKLIKTTNSGVTWDSTILPYNKSKAMFFVDANTGWIGDNWYSDSVLIIRTTNGGSNWHIQKKGFTRVTSIYFVNNLTGWAVGDGGLILKTITGGVTGIQTISIETPSSCSIYQNYPNPFNPSTKIKFEVPLSKGGLKGVVALKVFDILGREVATLVNEKLNPGTYEVEWNASQYPSGVYFYQLKSGDFVETKKLVLLK